MDSLTMQPEEIEAESFRIIDKEAGDHGWPVAEWQVVRRSIHTSADFEYAGSLVFSDGAVEKGVAAIKSGASIVTDTTMALSGIGKARLAPFGCRATCHVADPDVAETARREGITRSIAAMRKATANPDNRIFVIGNAPTALFELLRLVGEGKAHPALIIGLPVGFVGAEESKNALAATDGSIPFITNMGRKGGSNVAAAVVNALAIMAAGA
ncbi:precorrin-8X methylmutase [Geobacter sp. FeAm09]|uniref:precorrin-8X methylmutase n=1 Tax=Geobacter sp. FeAm09 TaxID=2597769 RepID=UPI0011EE19D6|nr:precorrin-8X methylmutase [Geobacter sp. FeAm09]QEM67778.1 precorrin-8X methylmutase [Geobacter sp. FeAm09]